MMTAVAENEAAPTNGEPAGRPPRRVLGRPRRDVQVDALIGALLNGQSVEQAAESANMARGTAYELLHEPEVRDRLRAARADALGAATRTAAAHAEEAVRVLASLMKGAQAEGVRRMAADSLLNHASVLARDAETEARIAELNAQLEALEAGTRWTR